MALSPCQLVQQWSVQGGAYGKFIGLDVKPVEASTGVVAFFKLEKHIDWLWKAVLGTAIKGGLRRTILIGILATKYLEGTPDNSHSSADADEYSPTFGTPTRA